MDNVPTSTTSGPLSPPPDKFRSYRSIQLHDIQESPISTPKPSSNPHRSVLRHKDSRTLLSRYNRGARTISTIKASYEASTSIERSDNHRAVLHHKEASLTLRERYERGRTALQETSAGAEFVLMWDALGDLKRLIFKALDRRARKNAEAKAKQPQQLELFKHRPQPSTIPTPIYEAHRKHRSRPAPKEFHLAYAAIKDQPRTPSPPPLPIVRRKPVPETPIRVVPKYPVEVTESLPTLRRSHHITPDDIAPPPIVSRPKTRRPTRFSDFIHPRPRVQSNILKGSDKQLRQCEVCGTNSSAATGAAFSKQKLWLCSNCQTSDGSSGELPPLTPKLIQRHQLQPVKTRMAWNLPLGKDLVWNCEHCHASFSSGPPARVNLCICPICKKEIAAHPAAMSRAASKASKTSKGSQRPSSLSTRGNERSRFSQVSEVSEGDTIINDNGFMGLVSLPSIYRPSLYEGAPGAKDGSPVSPVGQGQFDSSDKLIHPAFRPLPPTPGLSRAASKKRPETEWRNSMSTPIPGIDKDRSYQKGPVTHLAYEFPSDSAHPSAATTAMDLSLPLTPQVPQKDSAVSFIKPKTEQRKEAQYEKLRDIKHMASSIYPKDEEEKVYTSNKPLPVMPGGSFFMDRAAHDVRRESFYPMSPERSELEAFPDLPTLSRADIESGVWPVNPENGTGPVNDSNATLPVNRRSSFYGFYKPLLESEGARSRRTLGQE